MLPNQPTPRRLVRTLLVQLVPAIIVSAGGIVLLGSLTEPTALRPPAPIAADTAITTEAVFTPTPQQRPAVEQKTAAIAHARPKPPAVSAIRPHAVAASEPLPPPRPAEVASAPLSIVPAAEQRQPEAAPPSGVYSSVVDRLRGATVAVQALPHRAYSRVARWFTLGEPPRPPAEIPERLNAAM